MVQKQRSKYRYTLLKKLDSGSLHSPVLIQVVPLKLRNETLLLRLCFLYEIGENILCMHPSQLDFGNPSFVLFGYVFYFPCHL
jgi:hypothetical protein